MDQLAFTPHATSHLHRLDKIAEEGDSSGCPVSAPRPETPIETMEFLGRSWSLTAMELSKALTDMKSGPSSHQLEDSNPCTLSSGSKVPIQQELLLLHQALETDFITKQPLLGHGVYRSVLGGKSVGRWLKDQREKKKEENRTRNAQIHAAMSVAGVAAAVAAIAAATAISAEETASNQEKGASAAVASAAALVASHCIEMAEGMGADHDQMLTLLNSAVKVKTSGEVRTLSAAAATALRGAVALSTRLQKGGRVAMVGPTDRSSEADGETTEKSETTSALIFVSTGGELLKRTRKGVLHWKQVSLYINSSWQVVVKMKSKHVVGTFVKKKSIVSGVCCNPPIWPGREDGDEKRAYFAIRTPERLIEFECRNELEKQMWINGIRQMLHCHGNMSNAFSL